VGGDIKMTDQFLIGIAFNYTEDSRTSAAGPAGSSCARRSHGVRGYGNGPWWVRRDARCGNLDYNDVHRGHPVGALTRRETGSTTGSHIMAQRPGRLLVRRGHAAARTVRAARAGRTSPCTPSAENGSDSTGLSFGEQKAQVVHHERGMAGHGPARDGPAVRARDVGNSKARTTIAASARRRSAFRARTACRRSSRTTTTCAILVGGAMDSRGVTGYITAEGTSGRSDGNGYAVTVGERVPL
jgi:hypothetical protein